MEILAIAALVLLLGVLTAWTLPHLVCPWREQVALRKLAGQIGFRDYGRRTLGIPSSGRAAGTPIEMIGDFVKVVRGREPNATEVAIVSEKLHAVTSGEEQI